MKINNKPVYKNIFLDYWQNWHQQNEFIRAIGQDSTTGIYFYNDLYIFFIPEKWWEELYPFNYYFHQYHWPFVYKRYLILEQFLNYGSLPKQFGPCQMSLTKYNMIFPDWLKIEKNNLEFKPFSSYEWAINNNSNFITKINNYFKDDYYPYLTNLNLFEQLVKYHKYLGLQFYKRKMEFEDTYYYWFPIKKEKWSYINNIILDNFIYTVEEINKLIYIINYELILLLKNGSFDENFYYFFIYLL